MKFLVSMILVVVILILTVTYLHDRKPAAIAPTRSAQVQLEQSEANTIGEQIETGQAAAAEKGIGTP